MNSIKKKVAIIGTVGIPANYSGFETLVEYLTKELNGQYDITVFCSKKRFTDWPSIYNGARMQYINLDANGIQSILYDIYTIFKSLKFADTILILGVSGCIVLPIVKMISNKKIIVNTDGLEWKRAKWGKAAKIFLKISEKIAAKYADVIVSDNKILQQYISQEYGKKSALIAYGGDQAVYREITSETIEKYPFLHQRYAFNVSRIEPENNIDLILSAFEEVGNQNLVMIGNWKNSEYGKNLKQKYADIKNIFLIDAIYDQDILNQFRSNCFLYLHGHSVGGTNPSLVEAMNLGLPIFAFGVNYNRETTQHKAEYFTDKDDLISLINNLDDKNLAEVSHDMYLIAKKNYTWKGIAKGYSEIF